MNCKESGRKQSWYNLRYCPSFIKKLEYRKLRRWVWLYSRMWHLGQYVLTFQKKLAPPSSGGFIQLPELWRQEDAVKRLRVSTSQSYVTFPRTFLFPVRETERLLSLRWVALNEFYKTKSLHRFYLCLIKNHTVRMHGNCGLSFTHSWVEVSSELHPPASRRGHLILRSSGGVIFRTWELNTRDFVSKPVITVTELLRYAHIKTRRSCLMLTNNKETQRKNVWRSGGVAPLVLHHDIRWM